MYHGQRKSAHVLCRSGVARLWRRCLACPGRVCGVCATGSMGASIGRFWDWRLRGRRAGPTRSTQGISLGARQNHGRRWVGTVGSRARWHSVDVTLGARSQCRDEEKTAAVLGVLHWVKSGARGVAGSGWGQGVAGAEPETTPYCTGGSMGNSGTAAYGPVFHCPTSGLRALHPARLLHARAGQGSVIKLPHSQSLNTVRTPTSTVPNARQWT